MKKVLKFLHMLPLEAARSVWHPVQQILTASTHTPVKQRGTACTELDVCLFSLLCSFIPESPPRWNGSPLFSSLGGSPQHPTITHYQWRALGESEQGAAGRGPAAKPDTVGTKNIKQTIRGTTGFMRASCT